MNETYVGEVPPAAPRISPYRKWGQRLAVLVGLSLLVLPVLHFWFQHQLEQQYQAILAETDRLDPGWQWADLSARRTPVPDDQNSALTCLTLRKQLPATWPPLPGTTPNPKGLDQRIQELAPNVALGADLHLELLDELETVEATLVEARGLLGQENGRFPLVITADFFSTPLTGLQDSRAVGTLLYLDAVQLAHEGNGDDALDSVRALLNVGRSIGDEPMLIAQLIRLATFNRGLRGLERILGQGQPSLRALTAARQALAREEQALPGLLLAAVRGERAGIHIGMLALERGDLTLSTLTGGGGSVLDQMLDRLGRGIVRPNHIKILELTNRLVEIAKLPLPEQVGRLKDWQADTKELKVKGVGSANVLITLLVLPGLDRPFASFHRSYAHLRCAETGLAVEQFRQTHGRWPTALAELCPQFLPAVPVDPYDNQPLRYRRLADGVLIYSIGPDETDDGGNIQRDKPANQAGTDVGFQLWDVSQRRVQPGP